MDTKTKMTKSKKQLQMFSYQQQESPPNGRHRTWPEEEAPARPWLFYRWDCLRKTEIIIEPRLTNHNVLRI